MNYKTILTRLDFWQKHDNKLQKAVDKFTEAIAPSSYAPIVEGNSATDGYLEGVSNGNKRLQDWLEYYIYEVKGTGIAGSCSQKLGDKVIKCKDVSDKKLFAKFLEDIFLTK